MKFDVIITNPPFQDTTRRKKTPHKLWIDFTMNAFQRYLKDGGSLVQVSPASFASPSNKVLSLMGKHRTRVLRLDTEKHFPGIGSSFSDYWIIKEDHKKEPTMVITSKDQFSLQLDDSVIYLPNDLCEFSLSVHSKVVFNHEQKLPVEWDYVNAHNIRRYDENATLVEFKDDEHEFPVFHTNRSTWWSSIRQEWANAKKVMWTRSGYTVPFFDDGVLGGTDMAYFVRVKDVVDGENLSHNLNTLIMRYIYKTAKWSGFGNERVFSSLPSLPRDRKLSDEEAFSYFGLSDEEVGFVRRSMEKNRKRS